MTLDLTPNTNLPPVAPRDLDVPDYYIDENHSVYDADRKKKHDDIVADITIFARQISADADRVTTVPKKVKFFADRGLTFLTYWAEKEALLGKMITPQAEFERKWNLCGFALSYIKMKAYASPEQRKVIENWLIRLADASFDYTIVNQKVRNDHFYWLGLALGSVAVAARSDVHWERSREIIKEAIFSISDEGTIPTEIIRGSRALHYHGFSAVPIILTAALAKYIYKEDMLEWNNRGIDRLVSMIIDGLDDPKIFDAISDVPQELPIRAFAGWIQMYNGMVGPDAEQTVPSVVGPAHRWLGGDVNVLRRVLVKYNTTTPP
jgi:poly(beta-D-mannuronate) lyase